MSNFLLLKDKSACPVCRAKTVGGYDCNCRNCGTKLFLRPTDFKTFERETAIMYWWCWHPQDGWRHRDFYMVPNAKPNHRVYIPPKLDKDYGTKMPPARAKSRRIARASGTSQL